MITLRPSALDLAKLKTPLGHLLEGEPEVTIPRLRTLIEQQKPSMITAVGDVVAAETLKAGLRVDLRIIDQRSMRKGIRLTSFPARATFKVRNPAGVISLEAWNQIRTAISKKDALVMVEGEEDLLALPAIVESPDNAIVLYGQPSQGLVVVTTTPAVKTQMFAMLNSMTREESE